VAAAAVPLGKGSCSTLMYCRLAGTARKTPSQEMQMTQGTSQSIFSPRVAGSAAGLSISSAGMALATPALVIEPAAEAADCMALFSRMVNWGTSGEGASAGWRRSCRPGCRR